MLKNSGKIQKLKEKKDALTAEIRRQEARERLDERNKDKRRKIILGAYLQERMKRDVDENARVLLELRSFLTRKAERQLFGIEESEHAEAG